MNLVKIFSIALEIKFVNLFPNPKAAVEPIIGHLKSDYRLNRNHLNGQAGDHANVVLAAAAKGSKCHIWGNSSLIPIIPVTGISNML
jgi:IS5 family transposase